MNYYLVDELLFKTVTNYLLISMKVALCFFGLNRSFNLTYNSIFDKLIIPLKNSQVEYDCYFYQYILS